MANQNRKRRRRKSNQIAMTESLWKFLGVLGDEIGYEDDRGVRSKLAREILSAAAMKWHESPYVCQSAEHVVLVTGEGHVFYRQVQLLKLNSARKFLPCMLEMKPEKMRDFRRRRPVGIDEAEWFRSRWMLNYFSAWLGDKLAGDPLSSFTDEEGTDSKVADLLVDQVRGRSICREMILGVREYVQWQEDVPGYDRIDLPIDIPTRNLKFVVVVDLDLYKNSLSEKDVGSLDIEFRNREGARFEGRDIARDLENNMVVIPGHVTGGSRSPYAKDVLGDLKLLKERIDDVAHVGTGEGPILTEEGRQILKEALGEPERFLFLKVEWPTPYWGIEVCIRWEKPIRP